MAMSRTDCTEKVQRLKTALKKTKSLMDSESALPELHPGTDIARNWTVITSAYSGLEQTFKYLIAVDKGISIQDLIDFRIPKNIRLKAGLNRHKYRTHDLAMLFLELDDEVQNIIEEHYSRFQSLHSYIVTPTVRQFLQDISGPNSGQGYERWRYTLIEDKPLPKNSPEALISIWDISIQVAIQKVWENQRIRMTDVYLKESILRLLHNELTNVTVGRQNRGEQFQDIDNEVKKWLWQYGDPINSIACALWHFARFNYHGQEGVSDWFSEALEKFLITISNVLKKEGRTSLRTFVNRAQGLTPEGSSIRWNSETNRFEPVPWSMPDLFQNSPPSNGIKFRDTRERGLPLALLWYYSKAAGYKVLENRSYNGSSDDETFFCTHRVVSQDVESKEVLYSLWQRKHDWPYHFVLVRECDESKVNPLLQQFINMALEAD